MSKPIINLKDVECQPLAPGFAPTGEVAERYGSRMGSISRVLGAQKLGYNITVVPPGKRAFPFHNHRINEEMFLILEGTGEVRIGEEVYPLQANDVVACPPGDESTAHQIINTGDVDLRYLAVSTKESPEVANYPDTGKFAVLADYPPKADGTVERFMYVGKPEDCHDYWAGE